MASIACPIPSQRPLSFQSLIKPYKENLPVFFKSILSTIYTMSSNPGDSNLEFDDSRIKNYPDKLLLSRIREYFIAFASGDFDGMNNLESTDYNITDIRKKLSPRSLFLIISIVVLNSLLLLHSSRYYQVPQELLVRREQGV